MDYRRGNGARLLVRIQDSQSAAGWEPQASVAGLGSATAGRVPGRALGATQAFGHAIIHRLDGMNLAHPKIVQLLFSHAADSARRAEPQRSVPIILDMRDIVAEQPVLSCDVEESSIAQTIQ